MLELAKGEEKIYSNVDSKKINIHRALKKLENINIIEKTGDKYKITDPLLDYWIKRKILKM